MYSVAVWHVSSRYSEATWESEKTQLVQKALDNTIKNQELSNTIAKAVETGVSNIHLTQQTINQKVIHEITKERVYTDCTTTPNGMQLIEDAIHNKGQSPSK